MKIKQTLSGEKVVLMNNNIVYLDENNKTYKYTTFLSNESAKKEYNRITDTHLGRPYGSIDPHSRTNRPQAIVNYWQMIIC